MEAKELRIGNLVRSKTHKTNIEINQIDGYNFYSTYEPIELTEEWLIKFGFKKQKCFGISNYWSIKTNGDWYSIYEKNGIWYLDNIYTVTIKYIHKLQNVYFELTNKELKI